MSNMTKPMIEVFDTTLRDGLQVEGVSASVEDKLSAARRAHTSDVAHRGWYREAPLPYHPRRAGRIMPWLYFIA